MKLNPHKLPDELSLRQHFKIYLSTCKTMSSILSNVYNFYNLYTVVTVITCTNTCAGSEEVSHQCNIHVYIMSMIVQTIQNIICKC